MKVNIVTAQDLEQFKQELLFEIASLISEIQPKSDKEWMSDKEVMEYLGIGRTTLYKLRVNGDLPFTKRKSKVYYLFSDVKGFLAGNYSLKNGVDGE